MKTVIAIIFFLFIGTFAQAQQGTVEQKAETIKMEIVSVDEIKANIEENTTEVARLYRRADYRVKKALSFSTKRDRGIA